jgi:hypothetical protein
MRRHRGRALRRRYGRAATAFKTWDGKPLETFDSMADVLVYAAAGGQLYYKAPMNVSPQRIEYKAKARSIRVFPPGSTGRGRMRTSDPFTADKGHLDRFLRPVGG